MYEYRSIKKGHAFIVETNIYLENFGGEKSDWRNKLVISTKCTQVYT